MASLNSQFRLFSHGANHLENHDVFTAIGPIQDSADTLIFVVSEENPEGKFETVPTELLDGYAGPNMVALSQLNPVGIEQIQKDALLAAVEQMPGMENLLPEMDAIDAQRIFAGNFSAETAAEILAEGDINAAAVEYRLSLHNTEEGVGIDIEDPEHATHIVAVETLYAKISLGTFIPDYANQLQSALEATKIEEFGVTQATAEHARQAFSPSVTELDTIQPLLGTGQTL